ncbi:MAG: adenylosuccinate synthetase [Desulfurococcales archaeon ex4484_58]|nr:MAG: adenylosuccinate synthetase [Desulfurococcales archaeon ex4484_58]
MLTVVVGGFFGDEGKGKIVSYLGLRDKPEYSVRCGSINAGHTVVYNGRAWKLRILSTAFINRETKLLIPPGALVKVDLLFREIEETNSWGRVFIDWNTGIIEDQHVERERRDNYLADRIGSTLQGVGVAMVDRVSRRLKLARDYRELKDLLIDVPGTINEALDRGSSVLVEGTQGAFLSLYHGTYPYVTSRDTIASAFLSEIGVGPKRVDQVVVVFKAYVTRVGGGPLPNELSIDEAMKRGWFEKASVTGRVRRVAPFNLELARRAVMLNSATQVAITKIDKLYPETRGVREWSELPGRVRRWIEDLEDQLKTPITLIGTGEDSLHIIDRRREYGLL